MNQIWRQICCNEGRHIRIRSLPCCSGYSFYWRSDFTIQELKEAKSLQNKTEIKKRRCIRKKMRCIDEDDYEMKNQR
ncbi:hypothetical protein Hdeb2414_s0009g00313011 [Helianthus debilis subsp. tardiflorus]